jgi:pimeloyl-ACP methyl ester carboxylesterase
VTFVSRALKFCAWALLALLLIAGTGVALTWTPDVPVSTLRERWAPSPSTFIDVAGQQVHVRDEGPRDDPTPIVLIHGTSASLHTWEGWAAALRGTRRVVTFDLPGFGLTGPNASGDYSDAGHVRFTLALLDTLGLKRVVLGGNSLGGAIAWQTAAAAPERVAQLILVDAGGYPLDSVSVPIGFRIARLPVLRDLMRYTLPRGVVESSVRNVYGDPSRVTPELVDRYMAMTSRAGNREALGRRMSQIVSGQGLERIAALNQPTLILWGGRDRLIPPAHAQRFARDIKGSTLVMFDELGHVPQEEDPARTVVAVQRFLASSD